MKPLYKLLLTVVIGSAVFVGGFFYYKQTMSSVQKQVYGGDEQYIVQSQTKLPDFVEVYEKDGQRRLKNTRDGYDIALESNWRPEYYTNIIEVFVEDNYVSDEMMGSFDIIKNTKGELSLEEWSKRWEKFSNESCSDCYERKNDFSLGGISIIKYFDKAGMAGNRYQFLFIKDDNFYSLSTANLTDQEIEKIIVGLISF